ncbi:IS3 family transposase [Azospirillum argentinense]|nr:IS3 family transposase [Azospirillum argentinense]
MTTKRRFFTDEFKREAVALLESSGRPLEHVAKDLGIQPSMLRTWRRRVSGPGGPAQLPTRQAPAPLAAGDQSAEIARLKRELDRVRMERDILKKTGEHFLGASEMRFRIVEDCRDEYPVRVLCDALGVSPSGYYAWRTRPESPRQAANRQLLDDIRRLHADHRERYGAPRIHAALWAQGRTVSRGRVERLMHRHGLRAQRPRAFRVCTTDSNHALPIAPNLLDRNFTPTAPNQVWLTDITYVPTDEGWLYLAVVLDLFSRKAIGWAMRDHLRTELPLAALTMALQRPRPAPGLLHPSDRGCQYASAAYRKALKSHGITPSMSRKGNCWDNAPMESFFGSLKSELVHHHRYATREDAKRDLFGYIEGYYNRQRLHSAIGYITPEQAERQAA